MSSLRRPISSTSSLSNSTIGNPLALICSGMRSKSPPSERTIAQGCIARWRGRPSSSCARATVIAISGADVFKVLSSGSDCSTAWILRARTCGIALARRSISAAGRPSAAPVSRMAWRARYVSNMATVAAREIAPGSCSDCDP